MNQESRPPFPPFTLDTATQKVRMAEDAWNTRDPEHVALAYTEDTVWRNRTEFLHGRAQVIEFLRRKWNRELDYRLKKTLWAFTGNRIAVRFEYEYHDDSGQWYRAYGNENWEFDELGYMKFRFASINDLLIKESERKLRWERKSARSPRDPSARPDAEMVEAAMVAAALRAGAAVTHATHALPN
jgi:nuclear transport factor 2 (NTF2) superfamily protein